MKRAINGSLLLGPIFGTLSLLLVVDFAEAASFNCAKATTPVEKMICATPALSKADEQLSELYAKAVSLLTGKESQPGQLTADQRQWLRNHRNTCADPACIQEAYTSRIASLQAEISSLSTPMEAAASNILIEAPLGGWRNSFGEPILYTQEVHYPASFVSTQDEQSMAARIAGQIANAEKYQNQPFKLIINGIPMPLRIDNGVFSRPYSFGTGSNSVEVRSPDNAEVARVQFYDAYTEKTQPKIRVVLSWNTDNTDVDLHVLTPDGEHCFYGNRVLNSGGALDVDVTTGYGPEIFATPTALEGTYLIYVNYYDGRNAENGSGESEDLTVANVAIITDENTPDEKVRTLTVPMRHPGEVTLVDAFVYP